MTRPIRIGTRGSKLALWQAGEVKRRLEAGGHSSSIQIVRTTGDTRQDVSLASIGGKGVFIKELEEALERDQIDLAVHSLKDVPSRLPEEFRLAAFLERGDPHDVWVHRTGMPVDAVAGGTVVGTSAPRRRAQLRSLYPHLDLRDIRGNVDSRIFKVQSGVYDAAVLACAGLQRLGRDDVITGVFTVDTMIPAAGQGIVAVETLASRADLNDTLATINHEETEAVARCERGVLDRFGTTLDCHSAVAVHATLRAEALTIHAFLSDSEGGDAIRVKRVGERARPESVVAAVADELIAKGALEILGRPVVEQS